MIFDNLEKAIDNLKLAHRYAEGLNGPTTPDTVMLYRMASVQAFEYTYEVAIGLVRNHLKQQAANLELFASQPFRDLMRDAAAQGLVHDFQAWLHFRQLRGSTSHTYSETKAEAVYQAIPDMIVAAQHVHAYLRQHHA